MTITPLVKLEREEMGAIRIILVIDDGVYASIYKVYFSISKNIHHMHSSMKVIFHNYRRAYVVVKSLIIDHMYPFL